MRYPVVIHKDPDSDYGVTVPDLPGCFSAGVTMDEALVSAVEAIELHLEGLLEEGESLPLPGSIERHRNDQAYSDGVWGFVMIDLSKLSGRSRRVNITLPERLLTVMDRFAGENGETRSGLIARATVEYIASHGSED